MDSKGNDSLLKATKVTELNFNYGGYIPLAFGGFILLGCAVAYSIAVMRGNVDPILPLISDAAGSPPQNGIFGTLVCIGGMFGVLFMIQRYMIVTEKNRDKSSLVSVINKLSLFVGIISMLGITLVTGYPVNFYRNRDVWLMDVGLPHMIGGIMLLALGLVYIALQCVLTLFLKTKNDWTLPTRVVIVFICTATFVYHMITVPDNFGGIAHLYFANGTESLLNDTGNLLSYPSTMGVDLKLPIDTSGSYFISAVTEWAFVFFFCCFFFTFYHEVQEYSLLIVIETHASPQKEVTDESKMDFKKASMAQRNGPQVVAKPAPEVRKFLRRDSTCQTSDDIVSSTPHFKTEFNGLQNKAPKKVLKSGNLNGSKGISNNEVDAKLNKILSEVEKDEGRKAHSNGTQHSISTSCDDMMERNIDKKPVTNDIDSEAERIAIEKIDTVVKNAEKDAEKQKEDKAAKKDDEDEEKPSSCPLAVQ